MPAGFPMHNRVSGMQGILVFLVLVAGGAIHKSLKKYWLPCEGLILPNSRSTLTSSESEQISLQILRRVISTERCVNYDGKAPLVSSRAKTVHSRKMGAR